VDLKRPTHNHSENDRRPSWRHYQRRLRRHDRWRFVRRPHRLWILLVPALAAVAWWVIAAGPPDVEQRMPPPRTLAAQRLETDALLSKADVRDLLGDQALDKIMNGPFAVSFGKRRLRVESTIAHDLQHYLQKQLDRRNSRYVAIVVLAAASGEVLALVDFAKQGRVPHPSLSSQFPAASLFKVVTAAAALEACGYSAQTPLTYNGASHTLYKSQLKNSRNRYTRQTTLEKSFARSVNPVFGKIGRHCLGQAKLRHYAERFGFNRPIAFELDLPPSNTRITAKPYQWAEIASGFNHDTLISPLHGAILAAVVPAQGRLVEPSIIRRISDQDGVTLYTPRPSESDAAVAPDTARELARLMRRTVTHGTARKIFRRRDKDKVLSRLVIGGKTGSIDTRDHGARYDWFIGFADGPRAADAIAVAVLVAHEKYIGRRAGEYARRAMHEYFRRQFEDHPTVDDRAARSRPDDHADAAGGRQSTTPGERSPDNRRGPRLDNKSSPSGHRPPWTTFRVG
jgi:membrane peptidoglycan carboxypeptidase